MYKTLIGSVVSKVDMGAIAAVKNRLPMLMADHGQDEKQNKHHQAGKSSDTQDSNHFRTP